MNSSKDIYLRLRFGVDERQKLYNLLANFISDGVPIYEAVSEIDGRWRSTKNPLAAVTTSVLKAMRGGSGQALRLGSALKRWAPPVEAMAIDAGDQAGDLAEGLRMAARLTGIQSRVRAAIVAELFYPAFLMVIFFVFLWALSTSVIPMFESIVPRSKWSISPRILGAVADAVPVTTLLFAILLTGFVVTYQSTKRYWVGAVRDTFDQHIFPWTMARRITGALMMSSISVLLRNGIPFSEILERLGGAGSAWERDQLARIRNRMRQGQREGEAIAGELFDSDVRWEIAVYGRLTSFAQALDRLSERVVDRVIVKARGSFAMVRTLVMVAVAGLIVWVYGSFFQITMAAKEAATGG